MFKQEYVLIFKLFPKNIYIKSPLIKKMKKKRVFHCSRCGSPCEIYRKGKAHRVLVCPRCGILASNPLPLALLAAAAPAVIEGIGGVIGGDKKKDQEIPTRQKIVTDSLDKPNKGERYVKMALGG